MKVKIQSVHFDADQKLEDFISTKLEKLISRHQNIVLADVTLRLDKDQKMENKVAEIKLEVPGNHLFVKKQTKSFEESTDIAIEALGKQLKKYKDKKIGK
jgi:putative sigma-54 modulation protein